MPKISQEPVVTALGGDDSYLVNASGVTSTVTKKNVSLVYNVKDYGAVGDGITDDGTAINSAITAAGTNNIVYFPPGTYYSTQRHVPQNGQTWQGAGMDVTIILGNRPFDYSIYLVGSSLSVLTNFKVLDMTLNANNVSNASCVQLYYAN